MPAATAVTVACTVIELRRPGRPRSRRPRRAGRSRSRRRVDDHRCPAGRASGAGVVSASAARRCGSRADAGCSRGRASCRCGERRCRGRGPCSRDRRPSRARRRRTTREPTAARPLTAWTSPAGDATSSAPRCFATTIPLKVTLSANPLLFESSNGAHRGLLHALFEMPGCPLVPDDKLRALMLPVIGD